MTWLFQIAICIYFLAEVPDIQGCLTQGDDLQSAMNWIIDAIGTMLSDVPESKYPAPSNIQDLDFSEYPPDSVINIVEFDTEKYFHSPKTIKEAAEKTGRNIKETAELLNAPYRTVQNWFDGTRKPPEWVERLVIEKLENFAG